MERALVLGAKGMVGSALMDALARRFDRIGLSHEQLDVASERETLRLVRDIRPQIVIHAAAYTDVDGCETNPDKASRVNGRGTLHVALASQTVGARLVYLSTDYVFDGRASRPYHEDDPTHPINAYGRSKLEGERHIRRLLADFVIVRTQWLFGRGGRHFVDAVLHLVEKKAPLTIVRDQVGSPTYCVDLSRVVAHLLERGLRGVYHVANSSSCTWYDFALKILEIRGISGVDVVPVEETFLGRPAPRPHYSVLNCEKLARETGLTMRHWEQALREFLEGRVPS